MGKVGVFNKRLQLAHPEVEEVPEGLTDEQLQARANAVIPVYPATEKVTSLKIAKAEQFFIPLHQQPMAWAMRSTVASTVQASDNKPRLWLTKMK